LLSIENLDAKIIDFHSDNEKEVNLLDLNNEP